MPSTWVFQVASQVEKHGDDKASWYVGWLEPSGKRRSQSCGPGKRGKQHAEKLAEKIKSELIERTYKREGERATWQDFRTKFDKTALAIMGDAMRKLTDGALSAFERIVQPKMMRTVNAAAILEFIAARRLERGHKKGSTISVASINKELRHIKAALKYAVTWEMLQAVPEFKFLREPEELPTFMTEEHFQAIYAACDVATMPAIANVNPGDWWRGLLVLLYMTGWRINEALTLKRAHVDLDTGMARLKADNTKGRREAAVRLHDLVIEHLRRLQTFDVLMFPWSHNERTIYTQFARIQEAAGIALECDEKHEHTRYCKVYGFHDLRRAFATLNAPNLSAAELQNLMRHRSYRTTERYVNMSKQMQESASKLHAPTLPSKSSTAS